MTDIIFGTPGNDNGLTNSILIPNQQEDIEVFAGTGDDFIDASAGSATADSFDGDDGNDEIYAGTNDRVLGGAGNDRLDARRGGGDNRMFGGTGDDLLFAGLRDQLGGDAGNDQLFAGLGNSVLSGGAGTDVFWIATAGLPTGPNTITDFQAGADLIGIGGLGLTFEDLVVADSDQGATIAFQTQTLATLQGITAASLTGANFTGLDASSLPTVQAFFDAYELALTNPQNVATFLNLLAEDVTWTVAGDPVLAYPGQFQGREAVQTFFNTIVTVFSTTGFDPLDFLADDSFELTADPLENRIAVRVTQSGVSLQTGREFQTDFTYLLSLNAAGLVQSLEAYSNTYPIAAATMDGQVPETPAEDPLTSQPATIDQAADPEAARNVAVGLWQALINANFDPTDPASFQSLSADDVTWSFAIGGPTILPYVGSAQGVTGVFTELLGPLGTVVQQGALSIQESFVDGNRVLVRLREDNAIAIETGLPYNLDLMSWITVNDAGRVQSVQLIADTYQTVEALRLGAAFPLSRSLTRTFHAPFAFVTGSRIIGLVSTFDAEGNFLGVLNQANQNDSPLNQPSAITYGTDGNLYVTSSRIGDPTISDVLVFDGVSGEYIGIFGAATQVASGLRNPTGIKFGPDGNLYVSSGYSSQVLRYDGQTGAFLGVFAERINGFPGNIVPQLTPELPPDFTVLVFGPDGNLYVSSLLDDPDNNMNTGYGQVRVYGGPGSATPGQFLGAFGDAAQGTDSPVPLLEPRAIAFGPDGNLYVTSARVGQILVYSGPLSATPGEFLRVYADVATEVFTEIGQTDRDVNDDGVIDFVIQNGLGFAPDGNLYVSSSVEINGIPSGGSQIRIYAGPSAANAGTFLGIFGEADTPNGRLLLPTTPEFTFNDNNFPLEPRFFNASFVVGVNTDRPFDTTTGIPGFFQSDETDALAAYDQAGNFLGFFDAQSLGTNNPLDGIGGLILSPNGSILVSSQLSNEVLEYNSLTGAFMGVFGDANANAATLLNATGLGLEFPAGLNLGPDYNLYLSDLGNERILRFDGYTGAFLNVVAQGNTTDELEERFTDLDFGGDGRLYVGFNPALEVPALGAAQVQVYNPNTGTLVSSITGLDFAAALEFGPDGLLYIADDPASVIDPLAGQPLDPVRESRIVVYDIDDVHPLNEAPRLVGEFNVGFGNGGALSVIQDETLGQPVVYLSRPVSGVVTRYTATGEVLGDLTVPLPEAALGVDDDGLGRPTGSAFVVESPILPV